MKEKELLEELAQAHDLFISDLPAHLPLLTDDLHKIPASQYPLKDWNEAASYLFHTPMACHTAGEARQALINGIGNYTDSSNE